jgi:hypothetical protein
MTQVKIQLVQTLFQENKVLALLIAKRPTLLPPVCLFSDLDIFLSVLPNVTVTLFSDLDRPTKSESQSHFINSVSAHEEIISETLFWCCG